MSRSTTPASSAGQQKVFTINWSLLLRRLRSQLRLLATSARHRAAHTEYIPPTWLGRMRLTWFRLGLIALAVFVFTQKQIDLTLSVGADGFGITQDNGDGSARTETSTTTVLSMLPTGTAASPAPSWNVTTYDATTTRAYIDRFKRVARTEEEKFAIPAAAKMAMAILESGAGESASARNNNNHFSASLDAKYFDNAWSSWRAHSESLLHRFPGLANESVNYQQWIAALARTDYSRDPLYAQKLIKLIDRFDLDRL